MQKLLRLLTITSKSYSINSFSLSMIRMLLFAENRFIAPAFFSKPHLRFWGFPFAKSFEKSFLSPLLIRKNGGLYFNVFADNIVVINTSVAYLI